MATVTIGDHTFEVAPKARTRRSASIAEIPITGGPNRIDYLGYTAKEVVLEGHELSLDALCSLLAVSSSERISINIPDFTEGEGLIKNIHVEEVAGVNERTLYNVTITMLLDSPFIPAPAEGSVTVTDRPYISYVSQRKNFYGAGRHWIFYYNDDTEQFVYKSSSNGIIWTDEIVFYDNTSYGLLSLYFDGTYVHIAYSKFTDDLFNVNCMYRRGLPQSNGTISFDAEYIVDDTGYSTIPTIIVDDNGYPWICYSRVTFNGAPVGLLCLSKSSTKNGIWTTQSGFPYTKNWNGYGLPTVIKMTGSKVYMMAHRYVLAGAQLPYLSGQICDESGWVDSSELIYARVNIPSGFNATNIGDDIYVAFRTAWEYGDDGHVYVRKRTYGVGWGDMEGPLINIGATSGITNTTTLAADGNRIHCFYSIRWNSIPYPPNSMIYLRTRNGEWGIQSTFVSPTSGLASSLLVGSYEKNDGVIGLMWYSWNSGPWDLRYKYLRIT